ncbi:MAG: sigma-70 family RNA polymerase sigma factor [Anaerolineae bacterium]|nr:sigma-70 family RNA polymerase sigma factor [Anaerolineae bacterium]
METDDRKLVRRCQQGDLEAFKELVERYQRRVYRLAYGMLNNGDDAMDVVQETFIRVHRYVDSFKGTSSFQTWVYRIATNLCIDCIRRSGRRPTVEYEDTLKHGDDDDVGDGMLTTPAARPDKALDQQELNAAIRDAVATLSDKHREVILLREVEGLSYEEIANTLKINKGTVMSRLHHARLLLQKKLQRYMR